MSVVSEQRELSFSSLDEVVAEVERLASGDVTTSGNHTFPQIVEHLALALDASTGAVNPPSPPFFMRLMRPIMKAMVINSKPLKPGIKLPTAAESFFWPEKEQSTQEVVAHLKAAVERYNTSGALPKHPFFGNLTPEENLGLNLRHSALHLGFVHPAA